jgi:hypothetical protein
MKGNLLIGGGFFTHERLSLANMIHKDSDFLVHTITLQDLQKPRLKMEGSYIVLFGLKGMERTLRKDRQDRKKVIKAICRFMDKIIPRNMPVIVVDDWALPMAGIANKLRAHLFSSFNIKRYLLREYLTAEKYPKQVVSFTLPCEDRTNYAVPMDEKIVDIFFQGNISSKDRSKLMDKIQKRTRHLRCHYKLMTGGVKNTKDRLPFKKFLKIMARSHFSLHFSGSGYDCYRYNEIPSVGSIIVTPQYPWYVRNNYEDMKSCIIYKDSMELKHKVDRVIESQDYLSEMQHSAIKTFVKYHTSEVRYREFKNFIGEVL